MFAMMGEPTEEQKAEWERVKAKNEDLMNRFKRFLAEETNPEQLQVMHAMLSHIANCSEPRSVANWYEGMMAATIFVRDIRLSEAPAEPFLLDFGDAAGTGSMPGGGSTILDTLRAEAEEDDEMIFEWDDDDSDE